MDITYTYYANSKLLQGVTLYRRQGQEFQLTGAWVVLCNDLWQEAADAYAALDKAFTDAKLKVAAQIVDKVKQVNFALDQELACL